MKLRCLLGLHETHRVKRAIVGWRPVYKPQMGIVDVWETDRVCQHCGHVDIWAFPIYRDGDYRSGGKL